jgi:hypothetical protein
VGGGEVGVGVGAGGAAQAASRVISNIMPNNLFFKAILLVE